MKRITKQLLLIFIIFTIAKAILSYFIPAPSTFSDSYIYSKAARSFFSSATLSVHSIPYQGAPLYPILISASYIFQDMNLVYLAIKIINAITSSMIIFPSFLLAKEFLSEKKSLIASTLISLMPSNFSFSPYIMTENLFYPIFLFTIYLLYKSYSEKGYKYNILSGIFLGLSYLTKGSAMLLIPAIFIIFIVDTIRNKKLSLLELKQKFILLLTAFILILPWLLRNYLIFGLSLEGLLGNYANDVTAIARHSYYAVPFLNWIILYIGYFILTSGIIFFITSLLSLKDKKHYTIAIITFTTAILAILIAANHSTGELGNIFPWLTERPLGRYLDMTLPLFIITGFIGFNLIEKNKRLVNRLLMLSSIILAYSSIITLTGLFPVNNLSLSYLGTLKYILELLVYNKTTFSLGLFPITFIFFTLLLAIIPLIFLLLSKMGKLDLRNILPYLLIFFLSVSLLNYAIDYQDSSTWYNKEQMQLGLWFNSFEKNPSKILFDERDCTERILKDEQFSICEPNHTATIIGFWLNHNIIIDSVDNLEGIDYVISRHHLSLKKIKETPSGIFVYKTI